MRLPQGFNMALNEPPPFDPLDPATPSGTGWLSQDAGAPTSTIFPHQVNDLTGELLRMQLLGGDGGIDERDQLRMLRMGDFLPDQTQLQVLEQVLPAEITQHEGYYKRVDNIVHLAVDIVWANTNAGIQNSQVVIRLPYVAATAGRLAVAVMSSNFRADNAANRVFEGLIAAGSNQALLYYTTGVGQAQTTLKIGLSGTDGGPRRLVGTATYYTTGVRSSLWPLLEWYSLTAAPISSPELTAIECRYDGTVGGETIDLVHWPSLVVEDSFAAAAGRNRHTFIGMPADDYRLKLGNLLSDTFTVDP